jgi:hypothetical protein
MASTLNHSAGSRYDRLPPWLRDLDFVTAFFTWLFRLLSRGAEPLMTLSTIYVIIEAGVPAVSVPWLHFLAVAIMISAPEIILPGGFILAGEIRAQGNRRAWMLSGMCWLFVLLTSATLADLFIWHFTGGAFAALMWGRCAAAVGYSILFRVITYRREVEVMPVAEVQTLLEQKVADLAEALAQRIAESERRMTDQARQAQTQQMQVWQEVEAGIERRMTGNVEQIPTRFTDVKEQVKEQIADALAQLQNTNKPAPKSTVYSAAKTAVLDEENGPVNQDHSASEMIASWLSAGRKTVTFDEICRVSNCTPRIVKNRIAKGLMKRSPRNPGLYHLESVLAWLKSEKKRGEPARKPALLLVKSAQQNEAINE